MARFSRRQFSFTNGEVSPRLFMRSDMEFYYASLAECVNFLPDHKGNLVRRPPTRFVTASKDGIKPCLYPFNAGRDCPVIVEAYPDCFRFILAREVVLNEDGDPLEVPHDYGVDYCDLEYAQDCGAMFIAHENHPRQILRKRDGTFTLEAVESNPFDEINVDENCQLCLGAGGSSGSATSGVLRSIFCDVGDVIQVTQTIPADPVANPPVLIDLTATAYNGNGICEVSFPVGTQPGTYEVWDGTQSIATVTLTIGRATLTAQGCSPFVLNMLGSQIRVLDEDGVGNDDNGEGGNQPNTWVNVTVTDFVSATEVVVDYSGPELKCTDLFRLPAFADGVYPETIWIHQDRLLTGGDNEVTASETGDFFGYDPSDPDGTVNPDNAIYRRINSGQCSDIRWFWPMGRHLLVGTSDGLYSLLGAGTNGAFAADAVTEQRNQNIGAADIRPVQVGEGVFFVDRTRTQLHGTAFSSQYDHVGADEYTLFADHIGNERFKKLAYQQVPYSVIWAVTEKGTLCSMTTVVGQGVKGWARHELGGSLIKNHCCDIPEVCDIEGIFGPNEDQDDIYLVVKRTINGADRFYIEVLSEFFEVGDHHFDHGHVDCFLPLLNITDVTSLALGDGPSAFVSPDERTGDFSVFDGDDWFRYNVTDGGAQGVAPNTRATPIAGRDWVNAGTDDNCEWRKVPKLGYCDDPEFVSEVEYVYRQPCGVTKVAECVDAVSGLEHLIGEDVIAYADGRMIPATVDGEGGLDVGGCVLRVGFPYDSTARLLPYRQQIGSTDGAKDPSRTFEVNLNVMSGVWFETGTGEHNEATQQNQQWKRARFDVRGTGAPEPFTGWIGADHFADFTDNNDSQVAFRARGPWPCVVRSVETLIEASGGR